MHIIQTDFFQLNCLYRDQQILERCCRSNFNSVSACLPCPLLKGPLKWEYLDIYLTTYFEVRKFKYTSAMRVILFSKMSKIESKFRKLKKKWETIFGFWDSFIWKCFYKLSLLRTEYLLSAVSGLTNSPQIGHVTQGDFLELNCPALIKKYGKGPAFQISTVFRLVYHGTCGKVLWNGSF